MAQSKPLPAAVHLSRKRLLGLAVTLLLLYAVLPQLGKFRDSFRVVEHGQAGWIIVALGFALVTSFVTSGIYLLLAKRRLRYSKTLSVQFASLFASKLLPAGLGSLSLNFEYLRRQRHSRAAAGAVVATNNLLGLVGHLLLLTVVVLTTSVSFSQLAVPHITQVVYWIGGAIVVLVAVILLWFRKLRDELLRSVLGALKDIRNYRAHPLRLLAALGLSMVLTSLYVLCLLACAVAMGLHISFGQSLVVLTVGVAGGTFVPTPGGLGGAEAGLFAGLVAYRIPGADALAIVLVYRLLTYWLALAAGALAWVFVRRRSYV